MTKHPETSIDRLSALLERFRVRTHLFHIGPLCGVTHFALRPGQGFVHVLRRGELVLSHAAQDSRAQGLPKRVAVDEPSLLFYPRPLAHTFRNPPVEGADFNCATVEFEGGARHPLAQALPPLLVLPLARLPELQHTLALLFAETEQVRCGQRLLANRLFEVLLLQLLRWLLDHPEEVGLQPGLLNGLAHPQLARALVALHERPGEAWTLAGMAQAAGMSRSAFAAAFKATLGQSPAEHLADWRLALAQQALRSGRPLKQVADALGYGSASALSRAFARRLGQSPRAWLQQVG
jgi:AraC-like DNA-binding protein